MMELRSQPGEWIGHQVGKHGETLIVTYQGKDVAQICPLETTVIDSKGKCHGAMPVTFKSPL